MGRSSMAWARLSNSSLSTYTDIGLLIYIYCHTMKELGSKMTISFKIVFACLAGSILLALFHGLGLSGQLRVEGRVIAGVAYNQVKMTVE